MLRPFVVNTVETQKMRDDEPGSLWGIHCGSTTMHPKSEAPIEWVAVVSDIIFKFNKELEARVKKDTKVLLYASIDRAFLIDFESPFIFCHPGRGK